MTRVESIVRFVSFVVCVVVQVVLDLKRNKGVQESK